MNPMVPAAEPMTYAERVWLSEKFYRRCYEAAILGTLAMCLVAVVLTFVDAKPHRVGTLALAAAGAILAGAARGDAGYEWLRLRPSVLAIAGPVAVVSAIWPGADQNAIYFPVLGPLAIIACVASHRREALIVVCSLAGCTFAAALLDTSNPEIGTPQQLAAATIGVFISGGLLLSVVDWCASWALEEARGRGERPQDLSWLREALKPKRPRPSKSAQAPPPPASGASLERQVWPADRAEAEAERMSSIRRAVKIGRNGSSRAWITVTGFRGRQFQIFLLWAEGHSVSDIAAFLQIKEATVRRYRTEGVSEANLRLAAAHHEERGPEEPRTLPGYHDADRLAADLAKRYPDASSIEDAARQVRELSPDAGDPDDP